MSEQADIAITIAPETPLQDEVRVMIKALNAHLSALSPPEFCFQMTAEQIAEMATRCLSRAMQPDEPSGWARSSVIPMALRK